uniref:Uncharacterized protein n=1 Tax=Kalanchoe fedtschenkoi TaxID=63787 RepID=A0A7N0VJB8_KALFE
MIYPVPAAGKQPLVQSQAQPPPSHHSNGSFGTVFIVLAVITVISGLACFIGRLCNKRTLKSQHAKQKQTQRSGGPPPPPPSPYPSPNPNAPHPNNHSLPPQQGGRHERDMELGYPGSHQAHPGGPKDYSDTDNEFDKRSKSSNSKPQANGEGVRGGYSPSPFGARVRPDQGYSPEMRGQRHGTSPI